MGQFLLGPDLAEKLHRGVTEKRLGPGCNNSETNGNLTATRRARRQVTPHQASRCLDWRRVRRVRRVDLGFSSWERQVPLGGEAGPLLLA